MFKTNCNGFQYEFYDDHLTINGTILKYDQIDNIQHLSGGIPSFLFDYNGRRFSMPYPADQLAQILPYMKLASQAVPQPEPAEVISLDQVVPSPSPDQAKPAAAEPDPVIAESSPPRSRSASPDAAVSSDATKKKNAKNGCLVLLAIIVLLIIALFACVGGGDDESAPDDTSYDATTEEITEIETTEPSTSKPDPADDLSAEERNAYKSALNYLDYSGFSRSGLIKQLEYEGFSSEASEKAVSVVEENGEVDWEKECLESAKNYLDYSSFSRDGLIEQLEYAGFTDEQINAIIDEAYQ